MDRCPICNETICKNVLKIESIIANPNAIYRDTKSAKSAKTGKISITQCLSCGFSYNSTFDPNLIDYTNYAISLYHSQAFQNYLDEIIELIKTKYKIVNAKILEIGCGDGMFLYSLSKELNSRGIGYDPSYSQRKSELKNNLPDDFFEFVQILPDFFSEQTIREHFDIVILRHVIEHIPNPLSFLQSIFGVIKKINSSAIFMLEVPALEDIVQTNDMEQFIYEHCNYFSIESLYFLLKKVGFTHLDFYRTYNKYYTTCFCQIKEKKIDNTICYRIPLISEEIEREYISKIQKLQKSIHNFKRCVIWGASGRGWNILDRLDEYSKSKILFFVDSNPEKWGCYIGKFSLKIQNPILMNDEKIEAIIVPNKIYLSEISNFISKKIKRNILLIPFE